MLREFERKYFIPDDPKTAQIREQQRQQRLQHKDSDDEVPESWTSNIKKPRVPGSVEARVPKWGIFHGWKTPYDPHMKTFYTEVIYE